MKVFGAFLLTLLAAFQSHAESIYTIILKKNFVISGEESQGFQKVISGQAVAVTNLEDGVQIQIPNPSEETKALIDILTEKGVIKPSVSVLGQVCDNCYSK